MKSITTLALASVLSIAAWLYPRPSTSDREEYFEMCDASAVEMLGPDWFAVADDEDNKLRIYRRGEHHGPVFGVELSAFLGLDRATETDLEGSARLGDLLFWISSHGRDADGEAAPARRRFFATQIRDQHGHPQLYPVGLAVTNLLNSLVSDPRFASYGLAEAADRPPKAPGGLNIESLAAAPDGRLWVGFRNPVPRGRALLAPLVNPRQVVEGQAAIWGEPQLLNLGGLGIRDMTWAKGQYWILAGPTGPTRGQSKLYRWGGGEESPELVQPQPNLKGLQPEAIAWTSRPAEPDKLWILSDDGSRKSGGKEMKSIDDPRKKSFRTLSIPLPTPKAEAASGLSSPSLQPSHADQKPISAAFETISSRSHLSSSSR